MKKQVLASYSGKPGIVRLPSIESGNRTIPLCGKIASRSYSLSTPINENNKGILPPKSKQTGQSNKQYPIDQQMMSTIRVDIEKMIDLSQSLLQYNHSALTQQVQLQENLIKLHELFLPFLRDALAFFTSPNSFTDEDKTFITSSSIRSSSFSFLQQWKSVLSILDTISESGISSLFDFVNEKFNIIFKGIETVTSKPEKHTAVYENVSKNTSVLNTSATNLQKLISQLFENFTNPTSESVTYYFSEIKQFLSLYNDSFYNVFPKAGFLPYELASLKSDTLTASNDIMSSLRALFTFWPDFNEIDIYKDEIQKLLNSAVCQMRLPSSLVRLITPIPKKKPNKEKEIEKKVRPEFIKLEAFITSVLKIIEKPPLDPKIDLWKRLKIVENMIGDSIQNLHDTIKKIAGQTHNLQTLLIEADSRKKEIEKLRSYNNELLKTNINYQEQLEEVTKLSEKRKEKIEILQNDAERLQEKQTIEKVSTKLNEMMKNIDSGIEKLTQDDQHQHGEDSSDNNGFTSLEKLNIFVLEKKCHNCREYDQQRREIMKLLSPLITVGQGESLLSIIQSLVKRQEKLEVENAKISAEYEQKKLQLEKVEEETRKILSKSGLEPSNDRPPMRGQNEGHSYSLLESFQNMEETHRNDMKTMQDELKDSHKNELSKIAGMFDGILSEDDRDKSSKSGNSQKDTRTKNSKSNFLNDSDESHSKRGFISNNYSKSDIAINRYNRHTNSPVSDNENEANGCDPNDDENEFKNIVMSKVQKAANKIERLQNKVDKNNELMEKVRAWMKSHVEGVNVDELDFGESLSILMAAIDKKENPLQSKVDRLEKESQRITAECQKLVDQLCAMKHIDPISTSKMTVLELLKIAEKESASLNKKLENAANKADSHDLEIESTRDSLQSIAEKLHHLLQIDKDECFDMMDLNCLVTVINRYIGSLLSGGTKQLFISISDLNEMAKYAKKNSRFPNSNDPKVYLPDIFERFANHDETLRVLRLFEKPLDDIFKNFDFQYESFNPENQPFKFLREKIFQLHLILGKDTNVISDKKVLCILKNLIALPSALFSYIASSFLGGKEREPEKIQDDKNGID